jgi:hypothetical protein
MAKRHQQDQQNLTIDEMMRFLDSEFQRFPEHRAGNAVRYELADVLKSAFAMFALKSPSLVAENLALRQQLAVLNRKIHRPQLHRRDRFFWAPLAILEELLEK